MRSQSFQSNRETQPSEPRQIGEILPDVLRRYGLVDTSHSKPSNRDVAETRVNRVDALLGDNEDASSRHALTECHV